MLKNKIHIITSSLLFLVIVTSYFFMAVKFPLAYIIATYEDFAGEWAQVFFFISVFILSLRLSFQKSRYRLFFIVLALVSFYTFMEEISWGQRIFNIESPEFFQQHNLQRELNIHNFLTGPYSTTIKSILAYAISAGLVLYGLLYPMALKSRVSLARWIESKGLPSPPLFLWPFFVLSAVLELGVFSFNEAEIAEILIPFGLSIFLLYFLISRKQDTDNGTVNQELIDPSQSGKLALAVLGVFLVVVLASTGATYASYSSPRLKEKMHSRLTNGVEKFAGRYQKYDQWETAVSLYHIIDKEEPERASIQRKLAYCYAKMDNAETSQSFIEKAFDIDREKLNRNPDSRSSNLSIARTYKQIGDRSQEQYHLDRALEVALAKVEKKPKSARAAYWLGKAYDQRGNREMAFNYFKKAFDLKPHIKKYRKAYFRANRLYKKKVDNEEEDESEKG